MTESSQDEKIKIMTYSEVIDVKGFVGNFDVTIRKKARCIDEAKCTGCGECIDKCLTFTTNEWELGLGKRKAVYKPFSQAVPNVPVIDPEICGHFTTGLCSVCSKICPADAIDFDQKDELITEKFGTIIMATGFDQLDTSAYEEYGGGRFKDVITGLHLERMLESSGPTGGHVIRPSNYKEAKRVVFIQCAGSRDEAKGMPYCSRICCMYTAKQAILLKDHVPDSQSYIFYIDIRTPGKGYEEFYKKAQSQAGAIYIRGRAAKIYEKGDQLIVRGADTLTGEQIEVEADLVVLAAAAVPRDGAKEMAKMLNIPHDAYGFFSEAHPKLQPVESLTRGVYLAGACQFPKDVPDSVAMAGAAGIKACSILSQDELTIDPKIAYVEADVCSGCLNCVQACPFDAIRPEMVNGRQVANIIESLCQGCGNCAATCRTKAANVRGFSDDQIYAQISAPFSPVEEERIEGSR